jgi:hypothetical protein
VPPSTQPQPPQLSLYTFTHGSHLGSQGLTTRGGRGGPAPRCSRRAGTRRPPTTPGHTHCQHTAVLPVSAHHPPPAPPSCSGACRAARFVCCLLLFGLFLGALPVPRSPGWLAAANGGGGNKDSPGPCLPTPDTSGHLLLLLLAASRRARSPHNSNQSNGRQALAHTRAHNTGTAGRATRLSSPTAPRTDALLAAAGELTAAKKRARAGASVVLGASGAPRAQAGTGKKARGDKEAAALSHTVPAAHPHGKLHTNSTNTHEWRGQGNARARPRPPAAPDPPNWRAPSAGPPSRTKQHLQQQHHPRQYTSFMYVRVKHSNTKPQQPHTHACRVQPPALSSLTRLARRRGNAAAAARPAHSAGRGPSKGPQSRARQSTRARLLSSEGSPLTPRPQSCPQPAQGGGAEIGG